MAEETSNIVVQVVANGVGVTLASLSSIGTDTPGTSLLQLEDARTELELGMVCADGDLVQPLIKSFLEVLKRYSTS